MFDNKTLQYSGWLSCANNRKTKFRLTFWDRWHLGNLVIWLSESQFQSSFQRHRISMAAGLELVYCTDQSGWDLNCVEGDKTHGFEGDKTYGNWEAVAPTFYTDGGNRCLERPIQRRNTLRLIPAMQWRNHYNLITTVSNYPINKTYHCPDVFFSISSLQHCPTLGIKRPIQHYNTLGLVQHHYMTKHCSIRWKHLY